nr:Sec-independent protein translocase subunit TatA [Kibdelosporangium phytohabitans]
MEVTVGNLGATELLIIAVVVVLLFGTKKLPDMARSLGRSMRILKAETTASRTPGPEAAAAVPPETLARLQARIDELQRQVDAGTAQPHSAEQRR